jgi:hypothetical protein
MEEQRSWERLFDCEDLSIVPIDVSLLAYLFSKASAQSLPGEAGKQHLPMTSSISLQDHRVEA